ncbi:MAG: DUF4397 domain-containing protein [Burkholderiales bacterium]
MMLIQKLMLACVPLAVLAGCGGGDTEDRLDVADPAVRFVDVLQATGPVTLYRGSVAQPDATNADFGFGSNYFDVDVSTADWSVRTSAGAAPLGTVTIDPQRGTKYTVVALGTSATTTGAYLITDPYNKALTSDSTHLRLMNASYNVGTVDLYMNAPGTDITAANVNPLLAATAANTSGPAPGQDSVDIPGGSYQLTVTAAGTKTILFRGQVSFASNQDLLLFTVPGATSPTAIRVLLKSAGTQGTTEIAPT